MKTSKLLSLQCTTFNPTRRTIALYSVTCSVILRTSITEIVVSTLGSGASVNPTARRI